MTVYNVMEFNAVGDGQANDTTAIQAAIDRCHAAGGGTVLLPAGRCFLAGSFEIKSNIRFCVERGGRLIASADEADYPHGVFKSGPEASKKVWIRAIEADHFAITGGGVIDGRCLEFAIDELNHIYTTLKWRPAMTCFIGCRNIHVSDITLKDAANWALHLTGCRDVVIHGINILNNRKFPNCDGIDPDHCRNVRISDCHIEAGDDCIVLKNTESFAEYGPTENITVTGCTMMSTSCAIKIGSESVSPFRDLIFSSCVIKDSNRALGIQLRDEGSVENVLFSDMIIETHLFGGPWWGAAEPIYVTALPRTAATKVGPLRNIRFNNILCRGEKGIYIHGCPDSRPDDIVFANVQMLIDKTTPWDGNYHDPRPCDMDFAFGGQALDEPTPWGQRITHGTSGFFVNQADRIDLNNVQIRWGNHRPDYFRHAIEAYDVKDLRINQFEGNAAHKHIPAQHIEPRDD